MQIVDTSNTGTTNKDYSYSPNTECFAVTTSVTSESCASRGGQNDRWEEYFDRLISWGHPVRDSGDCEDYPNPSPEVISVACKLLVTLKKLGSTIPTKLKVDADSGIVIELVKELTKETIHVWDDLDVTYTRLIGGKIVETFSIDQ